MWSLFKKKRVAESSSEGVGDNLGNSLFDYEGESLAPMKFSNGKTQQDVVTEILDLIEKGNKIIFIKGVCGSGKSAIALNLAKHFKKTSIVVPIKSLQDQYEQDYTRDKFLFKDKNQKLKIAVIKGRGNFICPFSTNSGTYCDDPELPCAIEIKEKNMDQIKEYVQLNKHVSKFDFSAISDVRRMSIAPVCPYWSPLLPSEMSVQALEKAQKKKYKSISGEEYALFQRKKGCGYYDQYNSYINADVLIFNNQKYLIETTMGRKPKTDLDIIDECDEFLDKLSNEKTINLSRLQMALINMFPQTDKDVMVAKKLLHIVNDLIHQYSASNYKPNQNDSVDKLGDTDILELVEKILENPDLAEEEEENYYNKVLEIAKTFENLIDQTYVGIENYSKSEDNNGGNKSLFNSYNKDSGDRNIYINLVTINLQKRFQEIVDSTEVLVLMSGTLHSEAVLKRIFGINNFKTVEAETVNPGTISKFRTGLEVNCKYSNFKSHYVTRKQYLQALDKCIESAKPPTLVHVTTFSDLPNELEKAEYHVDNLITKERLLSIQSRDKHGKQVDKFKSGEIDLLFTTKCSRGIDFPGEKCNSVILTKYPYPNINSLFWRILRKEKPEEFTTFYLDKAHRELLQKIYRALRFKEDHIILLSPDSRILDARLGV